MNIDYREFYAIAFEIENNWFIGLKRTMRLRNCVVSRKQIWQESWLKKLILIISVEVMKNCRNHRCHAQQLPP